MQPKIKKLHKNVSFFAQGLTYAGNSFSESGLEFHFGEMVVKPKENYIAQPLVVLFVLILVWISFEKALLDNETHAFL